MLTAISFPLCSTSTNTPSIQIVASRSGTWWMECCLTISIIALHATVTELKSDLNDCKEPTKEFQTNNMIGYHLYADTISTITNGTYVIPFRDCFLASEKHCKFNTKTWELKNNFLKNIHRIALDIAGKKYFAFNMTTYIPKTHHSLNWMHLSSFKNWIKHPLQK